MKLAYTEVNRLLEYDPNTGVITWKESPCRKVKSGTIAGCLKPDGYIRIGIKSKKYAAQNIALLLMRGYWPHGVVDHINGIPSDNRWSNLREATISQNNANSGLRKDNTSGFKGVTRNKDRGKWQASIRIASKSKYLGLFDTPEEANVAYMKKAKEVFGAFANSGQ